MKRYYDFKSYNQKGESDTNLIKVTYDFDGRKGVRHFNNGDTEELSDFLEAIYGNTLSSNSVPIFLEIVNWAEIASIGEIFEDDSCGIIVEALP